jgi:oxygen-independent coproporphyrinogen-3 oxidase
MVADGLVTLSNEKVAVTASGKLLVRHICNVFDQYSRRHASGRFSKVI